MEKKGVKEVQYIYARFSCKVYMEWGDSLKTYYYFVLAVGYTTDDLRFIWQSGDPVQLEKIALPQFDIKKEDIEYGNCTKYYKGTGR